MLVDGQDGHPPTVLECPFQLPIGLLVYICLQVFQVVLIPIRPHIPPHFTSLHHLGGMYPDIQHLLINYGGG